MFSNQASRENVLQAIAILSFSRICEEVTFLAQVVSVAVGLRSDSKLATTFHHSFLFSSQSQLFLIKRLLRSKTELAGVLP